MPINVHDAGAQVDPDKEPTPGEELYAVFANDFYVVATEDFAQIIFGETVTEGRTFYRSAFVMPTANARQMAEAVLRLIRQVETGDADAESLRLLLTLLTRCSEFYEYRTTATAPPIRSGIPGAAAGGGAARSERPTRRAGGGARAHPHYEDRHEEYLLVTKDDLREIRAFGWMQQGLLVSGTFFFSGAFWLFIELVAHQSENGKFEFTSWMGMCVLSMGFGTILGVIAWGHAILRQRRLNKYPIESRNVSIPG